ncbi:hypothetical protein [Nocardia aurea]|uniref:hypothetical protein n=1 Tax=Nocardia aurea TaxID=2144174 RepID=UPI0033A4CF07
MSRKCLHTTDRCEVCGDCRACLLACYCETFGDSRDRLCPGHTWEQGERGRTCSLCGFFVSIRADFDMDAELRRLVGKGGEG